MEQAYLQIVATSLIIGLTAGFVMHRADFCVTSAFRDMFLFRDYFLIRIMALLVVISMILFETGHLVGALAPYPFPLLGPPSLSNLVGGFFFGIGMVLAGGCVVGTLYKMGSGHLLSAIAFVAMLAGSALYAEIHPFWNVFTKSTVLTHDAVTLPQLLKLPPTTLLLPLVIAGGFWLFREFRAGRLVRASHAVGHLPSWLAALILALLGFISYFMIGMPMGITTAYSKLGASFEALLLPDHFKSLIYFSLQPLNYQSPFSGVVRGGPGAQLDGIAAIQYPLIFGIMIGAMFSAWRVKELRLHWRIPTRQLASAAVGGLLLGVAARMAPSCNVWHLWGGLPILALQSLLFLLGLLPGTWVGTRLLTRMVIR